MFLYFIAFWRMIPCPVECKLLSKILQAQYNDLSERFIDNRALKIFF